MFGWPLVVHLLTAFASSILDGGCFHADDEAEMTLIRPNIRPNKCPIGNMLALCVPPARFPRQRNHKTLTIIRYSDHWSHEWKSCALRPKLRSPQHLMTKYSKHHPHWIISNQLMRSIFLDSCNPNLQD